jgi:hypothetical protein
LNHYSDRDTQFSDKDQLGAHRRTIQYTGELARLERKTQEQAERLIQLATENERLRAALKPFADAANEIPESLRSCLWRWSGDIDSNEQRVMLRSCTTDSLMTARTAYDATEPTPEEIEERLKLRSDRMKQIIAKTDAGKPEDTSLVNRTFVT